MPSASSRNRPSVRAWSISALLMSAVSLSNGIVRLKFLPPLPQLSSTLTETWLTRCT